jgi:hypothetical protein
MSTDGKDQAGGRFSEELRPYVDRSEADEINRTGERLLDAKPVPRTEFRTELHAQLSSGLRQRPVARQPRRLGQLVAAYAGSGFLLLLVAALGLAGAGPLAY